MVAIKTPAGEFNVWTKRIGNNPDVKMLVLHGGPGMTHEYLEALDDHLPAAGVEYYHYDQLGSWHSDQPDDPSLWEIDRFVDEVEQVRSALGLTAGNFFLYGHSWGGILGIEYALKYQHHLKGLIISNMVSSIPLYNEYAEKVLMPQMDQQALAEIKAMEAAGDLENPRQMELLMEHHYVHHILRWPPEKWPAGAMSTFRHINSEIYVTMQGPSELGASGKIAYWDRRADLPRITVPTLVMGATHCTMDPKHLEWMASQMPKGRYHHCPDGSHLCMYDDADCYFRGLIDFLKAV